MLHKPNGTVAVLNVLHLTRKCLKMISINYIASCLSN